MILKAIIRYDGGGFAGWQVQPGQRTIQGALEDALSTIASAPVRVHGAGRTDAGVHAFGQVCSFIWTEDADCAKLRRSLSKMLGPEIRVLTVEPAEPDFHARKSAIEKTYIYSLALGKEPDPFLRRYAWCTEWALDMAQFVELARLFEGRHDFAGFQGGGATVETTVRTVHEVSVHRGALIEPLAAADTWRIVFRGEGFLYKMVRNITGAMAEAARGRLSCDGLTRALTSPGPYKGYTAPACGLALWEVKY